MTKKERIEIRLPENIVSILDQYQEKNGIPTRTATIIELIRKGSDK